MDTQKVSIEGMNPYAHGMKIRNVEDFFPRGFSPEELERVYYKLTSGRIGGYSILESPSFEDVDEYFNPGMYVVDDEAIFEAIIIDKFSKTESKMRQVGVAIGRNLKDTEISVLNPVVGKPKRAGTFAYVTVQIPFSDGQTVSVVFHSPEGDRKKIGPDDQIIAFRWLLNKRDITHVVAPEDGQEVTALTIGKRLGQLVEKNHARFIATQKDAVEEQKKLDGLKVQAEALDTENAMLAQQADKGASEAAGANIQVANTTARIDKQKAYNAKLEAEIDAFKAKVAAKVVVKPQQKSSGDEKAETYFYLNGLYGMKSNGSFTKDQSKWVTFTSDEAENFTDKNVKPYGATKDGLFVDTVTNETFKKDQPQQPAPEAAIDHTTPEGYAQIMADKELQLKYQDGLDSMFQTRLVNTRNALRGNGWDAPQGALTMMKDVQGYGTHSVEHDLSFVGAGKNITGITWIIDGGTTKISDNLTKTPEQIAAEIDAAVQPEQPVDVAGDEQQKLYTGDANHSYTVYKINLDGSLSNKEELNGDELNVWMDRERGMFANIRVVRDDGKTIDYTDNGSNYVVLNKYDTEPERVQPEQETVPQKLAPAPQQDGNPAKRTAKIIYHHGLQERVIGVDDFIVRIEPKEGPNLIIDKAGATLSLQHLEKRNGKVMIDQAITFTENEDGTLELDSTAIQATNGMIRGKDLTIAQAFTKSLIDQGLAKSGILKDGRGLVDDEVEPEEVNIDETYPIGFSWEADEGIREVVAKTNDGKYWVSKSEMQTGYQELLTAEDIKRMQEVDIANKSFREDQRAKDAIEAQKQAEKQAEYEDVDGFTDGMAAMKKTNVLTALNKQIMADGKATTIKQLVRDMVAEGRTVGSFEGKRTLEKADGSFRDEKQITKTGMDYAEYLISKSEPQPTKTPSEAAVDRASKFYELSKVVRPFMSNSQLKAISEGVKGEEGDFFIEKMQEIANTIQTMPKTYEQDGKGNDAVVYLHYFTGSADWHITERDKEESQDQAFGLADIFGDGGELGYISINEITKAGAELDLYWEPKTIGAVKGASSEPEQEPVDVTIGPEAIDASVTPEQDGNDGDVANQSTVAEQQPPFVSKLESIISGQYDNNLADLEARFEEALTEAEQAGLDGEYSGLIEQVSDYYTAKLSEKAKEV